MASGHGYFARRQLQDKFRVGDDEAMAKRYEGVPKKRQAKGN